MTSDPHLYSLIIRESHLDTFGHVNNAVYLRILEEARWELLSANGYGLEEIRSGGQGPVILEIQIQFKKELRLRETVTVETRCLSYQRHIGKMEQKIFNEKRELATDARITFGLFDTVLRKLIPPTEKWLRAIGA